MDLEKDIREAVIKYSDILYKICIVILCNEQDVQDTIQETFCRYLEKKPDFCDEEHEKAWLIKVATNICRDMIRFRVRHPKVPIDEMGISYKRNCGYLRYHRKCSKIEIVAGKKINEGYGQDGRRHIANGRI